MADEHPRKVERGKTNQPDGDTNKPDDDQKNQKIWNDHQASLDLDS